ncbi:Uncharacterized protein dnm_035190 [Desulfonema magnum]|uniref:Uncharacterized protein n=1 Tax=Desulfonema magnum TaxID=45655 RepID=A0A975BL75_9BACT|nr:Uncharacterized protein dnm_035190 [Desulfonema magnum]
MPPPRGFIALPQLTLFRCEQADHGRLRATQGSLPLAL